jgi:gliding motility-associated-like protein
MFKNYFFTFQTIKNTTSVFNANEGLQSKMINSNKLFVLFFLMMSALGFSQTETFDTGIPATWDVKGRMGTTTPLPEVTFTNNWAATATGGYLSSGGVVVNPSLNNTVGDTAEYFLITKQLITPENAEVHFKTKQGSFTNRGTIYQIRISLANQPDLSSFNVTLQSWTETQLNTNATTYEEKTVDIPLPAGVPVYIAFVAITNQTGTTATSGDSWFVDNVRMITECPQVANVTIIPGTTSATINWTHPTTNQFGIEVVPHTNGHGATGTPVPGTTFTATPLATATQYDVYIHAYCDSETASEWSGPFTFTTSQVGQTCATPIVIPPNVTSTPYVLNSNLMNYYTETEYTPYTTIGSNCFPGDTQNQLSGNHLFFNYTPTTTGLIDITQTVTVLPGGGGNNCWNNLSSVMVFNSCADVGVSCLAAMTTGGTSTAQIPNFYVVAGHTYVIVMSSPFPHAPNSNAGICFTFTVSGSACAPPSPSGTTHNNLTQTSADFSWTNVGNLASSWNYVVLPASLGAPTGSTSFQTTTTNSNNPAGIVLTAATDYNLYVQSVCPGVGAGPWSAPYPFRTPCNVLPLNYYTGFNDFNMVDTCWSQLNLNNDLRFFTFGNNANSEPTAKYRFNEGSENNDMLISPQFHLDQTAPKRLRFKYMNYGNWGLIVNNPTGGPCNFEVKLSVNGVGAQNFTQTIVPLAPRTTAYNFVEIIMPLPVMNGDINLAWIVPPGAAQTGNWLYLDDVYIEDMPACSEPAYPVVTPGSLTTNSVNISWTPGYNNTQWQLIAQPVGTGVPTFPLAPGAVMEIVSDNPHTMTGLNPSTQYEFYMRAYCSPTVQSIWVGPINFNTVCIAQPTPYYESLNTADAPITKKFCWTTNNVAGDPAKWTITATEATILPQPITFFDPFVSYDDWLISVGVNAVGVKRLRYKYKVGTSFVIPTTPRGNFEVLMSSTPDFSTYTTLIPAHNFTNSDYMENSVIFTGTGVSYFAFRLPPNMVNPGDTGIVTIDDFVIEDAPACPNPTGLVLGNITTSTAQVSWTPGYNETAWQVVVQPIGSGVPTVSGATVNGIPTYTATPLAQDTEYEFYVRAACGANGNSIWLGPITFRTNCNPLPTPFLETFDSNSVTESCWRSIDGNGDNNEWNLNSTVNPMYGDQMAALFTGSNGDNDDWLISPVLTAHANQRLRFSYKTYSTFFEEDLKVFLIINGVNTLLYENNLSTTTDATGTVAGSNIITVASNQGIALGDVAYIPGWPLPYLTTVTGIAGNTITLSQNATDTMAGPLHVEFKHETINNTTTKEMVIDLDSYISADTNIKIGFYTPFYPANPWSYRGQLTFIDNVSIEGIPACPSPINVTHSNIIDTTVDINWEEVGTATSWQVSVQPFGTPAPVGNTLPAYLHTATLNPHVTVNGLTPSLQYQYYVRAICSGTSQSVWVGPFEFVTLCDFASVCQYTITTISGNTGQVTQSVNVMQNGNLVQALEFPGFGQPASIDYTVFLCSGIAFDLYWLGQGNGLQYSQAQIIIKDESNNVVWTSPLGLGTVNTNIYSGVSSCGVMTCPQPTNLAVSNLGVMSWTPGGTETSWEVAIQPLGNGTLPQSGTVVNLPNTTYTPQASDFVDGMAGTYEYFVRAVCGGTSGSSYWTGPKVFIRNDEAATAVHLTPNTGTSCEVSGVDASFIGATPSTTPTSCGGVNGGDIWYDFVATSRVHQIELSDFGPGSYYTSAYQGVWPKIIMSIYEVQPNGSLIEKGCSEDHSFVTVYSSELVVGHTYKIRLKLNTAQANDKKFHICITTPNDLCDRNSFNYDFEKLPMQNMTGVSTIIDATVVPGWRVSTDWGAIFFQEASNSLDVVPYSGGQCIQLVQDPVAAWNPNDPNIKGLYKDFDTSEITQMNYSFASATRVTNATGTTVALYAGPPSGPFTLVTQDAANSLTWQLIQGTYNVPTGQATTRFIFRTVGNAIGHILDAANFKAKVDIDIATAPTTLDCVTTSLHLDAHGVGHWEADVTNPGASTIATPNSVSTNITGITTSGSYIFHWITRYCDKTITIVKQGTSAVATVTPAVNYCVNQTAMQLTATPPSGNTLMWYTLPSGGTGTVAAPTPLTTTIGTTSYYVSAVDQNGCQGPRTEIVVTVNALPTAAISGGTTICSGGTATVTFTGTPNATVTYTINSGSNQTITLNASGTAGVTTSPLTGTATYALVSVTTTGANSCNQTQSGSTVINVNALPTATIAGSTAICSGGTATVTFAGTPNATVTYTINSGGNQTITLNASGTASITTPALSGTATYALAGVAITEPLVCNQAQSGSAVITITPLPTAAISGGTTICSGGTATITFTGTPNATVTYTVNSGSNQTITLNGTGTATITTPSLTTNSTYALVNVTAMGALSCNQIAVGTAVVNVVSLPTAAISGATTICSGGTASVTFTGTPNAVVTYTVNSGGNQTITLNGSGSAILTTPALTGNSTYTLVSVTLNGSTPCSQVQTGSVVIGVNQLPTVAISGSTSVCPNGTATITFTGTANATVTYTINSGSNQTITLNGSGTATITTPALLANATYTLVSVSSTAPSVCSQLQSGSAVITVEVLPTATVSSVSPICSGATSTVTFTGTPNATVTYTVNSGSNQTIVLNGAGTATITTPPLTSNSTYTLVSVATATCSQNISGATTITIVASPTASIAGATTICNGGSTTITFTGTPNATVTYTVNFGSNQTITLDATGTATLTTPLLTANTTYTLVNVASGTCSQVLTSSVTVTVNSLLTATISGVTPICTGSTSTITFTGTPNAVVTYTVNSGANQTITLNGAGTASSTTAALTSAVTYTLVSVATTGSPTCTQNVTGNVVITVNPLATQNLVFSYNATCLNTTTSPLPVLTANFATGGVFSSTTLTVNPATGAVSLASATIGSHTITYTVAPNVGNCTLGGTSSATININAGVAPVTSFDYDSTYCSNSTNAVPTLGAGFTSGGLFASTTGLSINTATGAINFSQSTPGTYTVTYTVTANAATCNIGGSSTDILTIAAPVNVTIEEACQDQLLVLNALPVNNSFNPNTVNYSWSDGVNANVGGNSDVLNIDNYFALYATASFPITFTVSVDSNGCIGTASYILRENPCKIIPRGISPNDDGDNDTFDLTGIGVREIHIFNRYGTKVYSYSGNYTNQWKGASDNGNSLPDGTYFYSITKNNDTTVTGWVYINR